jgi:fluoroquinolone transport system permease protein
MQRISEISAIGAQRLAATAWCDIRLQWRNGFYLVTAIMLGCFVAFLAYVPLPNAAQLLPALIIGNLLITTFYFVGALTLLERGEGTLLAQTVTPLRAGEYVAARVVSLTLLAIIENVAIAFAGVGVDLHLPLLLVGIALAAILFILAGFVVVARYATINEYLMPSMIYTTLLTLPLIPALTGWRHPLFYLHPLQAPLTLLMAAFAPASAWQIVYGIGYSLFWVVCGGWAALRAYRRHVIGVDS